MALTVAIFLAPRDDGDRRAWHRGSCLGTATTLVASCVAGACAWSGIGARHRHEVPVEAAAARIGRSQEVPDRPVAVAVAVGWGLEGAEGSWLGYDRAV